MAQDNNSSSSSLVGWIIIILIVVVLGGGGYLLYAEWKRQQIMPAATPDGQSGTGTTSAVTNIVNKVKEAVSVITSNKSVFPLGMGSRGTEAKNIQKYLNDRYNAGLVEDGIWGSKTNAALSQFEHTTSVSQAEYSKMLSVASSQSNAGSYNSYPSQEALS